MDLNAIASSWAFTCRSVQSASSAASRMCGDNDFAAIIMEMSSEFCMQAAPMSATELTERIQQSNHLITIIGSIANVSKVAAERPKFADRILTATTEFAARTTPQRYSKSSSFQLTEEVSQIIQSGP